MKNILIILGIVTLLVSCSKSSSEPDVEPELDYTVMVPKIKGQLTAWQTACNSKDYDNMLALTVNRDNVSFSEFSKSSVSSQAVTNTKTTITFSNVSESSTSDVSNGKVIFVGEVKIVREITSNSKTELNLKFEASFTSSNDKLILENWKLADFKISTIES